MPVNQPGLAADLLAIFSDLTGRTATEGADAVAQAIADNVTDPSGGSVADGDYGDITVDSGGTLWTIDAGVVDRDTIADELKPSGTALPADEALRALGTGADDACAGNDARLSDARTPTGAASGDLAGTFPSPTVSQARGLRESGGTTLSMASVADGEVLFRSGSTVDGKAIGSSAGTLCAGDDSRLSDSRAPSGAAGGDLSGTYPNPGVAKVAGTTPGTLGLALLDDSSQSAGRSTLGLGTIATQDASSVSISGGSISGIADLAVADGGTGASTEIAARTNLGGAGIPAGTTSARGALWRALLASGATVYAIGATISDAGNSDDSDATGPWVRYTSSTSGTSAGFTIGSTIKWFRAGWPRGAVVRVLFRTGASLANLRLWIGATEYSATSANADAPNSAGTYRQMACLRFSAGVDTNWTLYTADTSGSTTADTGVLVSTSTVYEAEFTFTSTSVAVRISTAGGSFSSTVTNSTHVPASTADLQPMLAVIPTVSSGKTVGVQSWSVQC